MRFSTTNQSFISDDDLQALVGQLEILASDLRPLIEDSQIFAGDLQLDILGTLHCHYSRRDLIWHVC